MYLHKKNSGWKSPVTLIAELRIFPITEHSPFPKTALFYENLSISENLLFSENLFISENFLFSENLQHNLQI